MFYPLGYLLQLSKLLSAHTSYIPCHLALRYSPSLPGIPARCPGAGGSPQRPTARVNIIEPFFFVSYWSLQFITIVKSMSFGELKDLDFTNEKKKRYFKI
jgi:hypothetical protein